MENILSIFKEKLSDLLETTQNSDTTLNMKEQAKQIGIPYSTFAKYVKEDDETIPGIDKLKMIADYYNVSTDYLLGRTETRSPDLIVEAAHKQTGLSEETINIISQSEYKNTLDSILKTNEFNEIVRLICNALCFRELMHFSDYDKLTIKEEMQSNKDLHSLSAYIILGLPDDGLSSSYKTRINELLNKLFDNLINERLEKDNNKGEL